MGTRIVAIGVSHWHSLYDSAYLRHLAGMSDMELVGVHDESVEIAGARAAALGQPPAFTDKFAPVWFSIRRSLRIRYGVRLEVAAPPASERRHRHALATFQLYSGPERSRCWSLDPC